MQVAKQYYSMCKVSWMHTCVCSSECGGRPQRRRRIHSWSPSKVPSRSCPLPIRSPYACTSSMHDLSLRTSHVRQQSYDSNPTYFYTYGARAACMHMIDRWGHAAYVEGWITAACTDVLTGFYLNYFNTFPAREDQFGLVLQAGRLY
jgi:hypothetical protein